MGKFLDFEEIRKQHPILDVVRQLLGAQLTQESENKWRGACPFCGDSRSFRVTTDAGTHGQGMAGCFKCGPKGDSIATVAKKFKVKANDAAEMIVDRMGGKVATSTDGTSNVASGLDKIAERLEYTEEVQALGISEETAKALGIGFDSRGMMRGRVLFPLYHAGKLAGYLGYAPDLEPVIKLPQNLTESNVVRFKTA